MKYNVGVIIPVYNQGEYLEECVDSVLANISNLSIQIVIVDDASTDDSRDIIHRVSRKQSGKINVQITQVYHDYNMGLSAARNSGIEFTNAEYIICLDADDKIPENYIFEMFNTLKEKKVDVVYADSECFGTLTTRYKWPEYSENKLRTGNFINCSAMFHRDIWRCTGGFDVNMKHGWEDYEFWIRAARAKYKFAKCKDTELFWRRKEQSMITDANKRKAELVAYLKNKHKEWYSGC